MHIPYLFIHSSIGGHLGCFHIFGTANKVARSHIYEVIKIDKLIETENRIMIFRGKDRENGEILFVVMLSKAHLTSHCRMSGSR